MDKLAKGRANLAVKVTQRRGQWQQDADRTWAAHCHEPLFTLGVGLYWGEGSKETVGRSPVLSLCNTDPTLLRTWLRWCRTYAPELALSFLVQIHPNVRKKEAEAFWRRELGFSEPLIVTVNRSSSSKGRRAKSRPLLHGVLRILGRRGSSEWAYKMFRFMDLAALV
jgi:hypothetical protein